MSFLFRRLAKNSFSHSVETQINFFISPDLNQNPIEPELMPKPSSKPKSLIRKTIVTLVRTIGGLALLGAGVTIVLPSIFFRSCGPTRHNEPLQYTGLMNRAQQAFYLENGKFTNSREKLGLGIPIQTLHYNYIIYVEDNFVINQAHVPNIKPAIVSPLKNWFGEHRQIEDRLAYRDYIGMVAVVNIEDEVTTLAITCAATQAGITPSYPVLQDGYPRCGDGSEVAD
jgi:hypothetical protein